MQFFDDDVDGDSDYDDDDDDDDGDDDYDDHDHDDHDHDDHDYHNHRHDYHDRKNRPLLLSTSRLGTEVLEQSSCLLFVWGGKNCHYFYFQ